MGLSLADAQPQVTHGVQSAHRCARPKRPSSFATIRLGVAQGRWGSQRASRPASPEESIVHQRIDTHITLQDCDQMADLPRPRKN